VRKTELNRIEKRILASLTAKPKTLWELFIQLNSGELETANALKTLREKNLIEINEKKQTASASSAEIKIKNNENIPSYVQPIAKADSKIYKTLLKKYSAHVKGFDPAITKFQQARIHPEEAIALVQLMEQKGDIQGNDIFILGDDDLISVLIAMRGLSKKIVVLEIDEAVIAKINEIAEKETLAIETLQYDVRKPLPEKYLRQFDTFRTDPPTSELAQKLFLSRCFSTMRGKGCAGYVGVSRQEESPEKQAKIQRTILEAGFVLTDMREQFTTYPETDTSLGEYTQMPFIKILGFTPGLPKIGKDNWWFADLWRVEAISEPNPPITGEVNAGRELYADEESLVVPEN